MSGPMAAGFNLGFGVVIAAQMITQGLAEVSADIAAADERAAERREQRRAARQEAHAASGQAAAEHAAEEARRTQQNAQLADLLAAVVSAESGTGAAAEAARSAALAEQPTSLHELFAAQIKAAAASQRADDRRAMIARVLERLELDAPAAISTTPALPPEFAALTREIAAASGEARATALLSELRLQVQRWNAARAAAAELRQRQEAAALVLEHTLKDLGYAVEDIEETLFVEGGVAHFRKSGWNDYFVRLRIDPQRNTMNFNVVRAGNANDDRKREDMMAEERWCSEYPALFAALEARGIPVKVTRLLQAGEAPVQVVDAASLPPLEETVQHAETLKARSLS